MHFSAFDRYSTTAALCCCRKMSDDDRDWLAALRSSVLANMQARS